MVGDLAGSGEIILHEYDAASQPTAIDYAAGGSSLGDLTYSYDADGRPIHEGGTFARATIPTAYGPATYDAANQITAVGSTDYTYDTDGNLTSDGTTTYTWNARNQLAATNTNGTTVAYGYDGLGRRTTRSTGSVTTGYLYDGLNTVQELTDGAATANILTGGLDQVFGRTTATGTESLLTDALGSTTAVADSTGALTAEYTYQPYGATTLTGDDAGNPTQYGGQDNDGNGLYYNRARYYSTADTRFTSPDPVGPTSSTANPYTYVLNQPTDLTDPTGLAPNETFYRGMSNAEYASLTTTRGLYPLHGESFVTQDLEYIQQLAARHPNAYDQIVRFTMEPGTKNSLIQAGARDRVLSQAITEAGLEDLPVLSKGDVNAVHIKGELGYITYGLRSGSVSIFNDRIIGFETMGGS